MHKHLIKWLSKILHMSYTNSEISISLSYIRPYFVWWLQLRHCATSILVLAAVSLLTFNKSTRLVIFPMPEITLSKHQILQTCASLFKVARVSHTLPRCFYGKNYCETWKKCFCVLYPKSLSFPAFWL